MANLTEKEKALKIIAKQIKELDNNAIVLDVLNSLKDIVDIRHRLYDVLVKNGYSLESGTYKLIPKK